MTNLTRYAVTVLATVAAGVVIALAVMFAVISTGVFNVAATVTDAPPLRWLLVATREASIRRHAQDIRVPVLGTEEQEENGFRLFRQECAMCHTPPGRPGTMMARGLNPAPPPLADLVDMTDAELFWVTKNGIRFTGMPAWVSSVPEQMIWDVVAFLRASQGMKAADYDALERSMAPQAPKK